MVKKIKEKYRQIFNKISLFDKRTVTVLLSISVLTILIVYIYSNKQTIQNFEWSISPWHIILAVIVYLIGLLMIFIAWIKIMAKLGAKNNFWIHLSVFSKSIIARRIPLPIWYIGSRFYYYNREDASKKQIAVATYIETILTGLSGGVLLLIIEIFAQNAITTLILGILITLIIGILFKYPKLLIILVNRVFIKTNKEPVNVELKSKDWFKWLLYYFASWLLAGISFIFCVYAITSIRGEGISLLRISVISGLIGFISMFLPAGFGLKELVTGLLMGPYTPLSIGLIVSIFYRVTITITEILWALLVSIVARRITHKNY